MSKLRSSTPKMMRAAHLVAGVALMAGAIWLNWQALEGAPLESLTRLALGLLGLVILVDSLSGVVKGLQRKTGDRE